MSEEIDWSKAPDGATHYVAKDFVAYPWHKREGEDVYFFAYHSQKWVKYASLAVGKYNILDSTQRPEAKMDIQKEISDLQARLDRLKAEAEKCKEPEIDWSKMIGRLVMVRDYDAQEWDGPKGLNYFNADLSYPFDCGASWAQCKLYDGPTRPNWIEWNGGECPIAGEEYVIVQLRDGAINVRKASHFPWIHSSPSSPYDIVRYSVIHP